MTMPEPVIVHPRACAWCGVPATQTIVVEPAVYRPVQITREKFGKQIQQVVQREVQAERRVPCCPLHAKVLLHDPLAAKRQRKRTAKGWAKRQSTLL